MIESLHLILAALVVAGSLPSAPAATPARAETPQQVAGGSEASSPRRDEPGPAPRELRGAPGRTLEELRRETAMSFEATGPGAMELEVVPHGTATELLPVTLELTRDGTIVGKLELECLPTTETFSGAAAPLACAPVVKRIDLESGAHRYGVRLVAGVGASAAFRTVDDVFGGLDLEPLAPPPPPAPAARSEQRRAVPLQPSVWQAPPPRVWLSGGVSLVALGLAAYLGSLSQGTFEEAAGDVTQLRRQELNDRGATQARAANVLLGAGGLGLGAAVVMAVVDVLQGAERGGEANAR